MISNCTKCGYLPDTPNHELDCVETLTQVITNNLLKTGVSPEGYSSRDYPPFAVTSDICIFTIREGVLKVLLIQRLRDPFAGSQAFPGGFVDPDEDAENAAWRELSEETGINIPALNEERDAQKSPESAMGNTSIHLEQLKTYSSPGRDPRMRVVSVAFVALAANLPEPSAGDDAAKVRWWTVDDLLGETPEITLAFDHLKILGDALERVRGKLEYTTLANQFVEEPFTLSDLRRVYKAVWGIEPNLANFRRKVLSVPNFVTPCGEYLSGKAGPKALLYKRGTAIDIQPAMMRNSSIQNSEE